MLTNCNPASDPMPGCRTLMAAFRFSCDSGESRLMMHMGTSTSPHSDLHANSRTHNARTKCATAEKRNRAQCAICFEKRISNFILSTCLTCASAKCVRAQWLASHVNYAGYKLLALRQCIFHTYWVMYMLLKNRVTYIKYNPNIYICCLKN